MQARLISSFLFSVFFLIRVNFSIAQEINWANNIGGTEADVTNDVVVDASGNIISVGKFKGTVDLDPGAGTNTVSSSSNTDTDGFIYKINSNGAYQWGFSIGNGDLGAGSSGADLINSVDVDASGNIYITGTFTGIVDFDPSGSATNLTSTCSFCTTGFEVYTADAFWAKYDSDGNFIAAFSWGNDGYDQGLAIKVTSVGDTYIAGHYEKSVDFDPSGSTQTSTSNGGHDIFLARYNSSNQLAHLLTFGSTSTSIFTDYVTGLDVDGTGNYYLSGYYTGNMNINPNGTAENISASTNSDGFIAKYNSSGTMQWGFGIGAGNPDKVNDCAIDASGNVYLTGDFTGSVDFDPGTSTAALTSLNTGNADIFVAKYSTTGAYDWAFRIGSALTNETGHSIAVNDEAIFVAGKFDGTANFDAAGSQELTSNSFANGFIASYEFSGAYRWAGGLITSTSTGSEAFAVDINTSDIIGLGGSFAGTADFDVQSSTLNLSSEGNADAFSTSYTSLCIPTGLTADVANLATITETCSVTPSIPTATDDCGNSIEGSPNQTFPITTVGTTTINWTYTDRSGNSITQEQEVIIEDITAPAPDDNSLPDLTDECSVTPTAPTATDNCEGGGIEGVADVEFPITTQGTTVVTWTFSDQQGNSSTQEQNVIIDDTTLPVPDQSSLPELTDECSVSPTAPTATDNCAGQIEGVSDVSFPITTKGTTVITWTFEDEAGNAVTQQQNVIIADVTLPVPDIQTLEDISAVCSVDALTPPTATDNCDGIINGIADVTFPVTAQGETIITWTYEDQQGNTSTQTQKIIINDNLAPVPDVSQLEDIVSDGQVDQPVAPTATDNCDGTISGTTTTVFPLTVSCNTIITWNYEDSNGNITTQNQNVIVSDNNPPVPDITDLTVVVGECSITSIDAPTATDACDGEITGETTTVFPVTTPGTTTIAWTYTDSNGNSSTQTQEVTLTDTTDPTPDQQTLEDIVADCQVGSLTIPTATDNCSGSVSGQSDVTFPITGSGKTTVTWTYSDESGNTTTQQQNVIIQDNEAPVPDISDLPIVYTECDGTLDTIAAPSATDNCAGSIIATTNQTFPFNAALDTTDIVWEYDDGNGNTNIQFQKVVKLESFEVSVDTSICENSEFTFPDGSTWDGITLTQESILQSSSGCDSTITTNITVLPSPEVDLGIDTVFFCVGDELAFGIDEAQIDFETYRIFSIAGESVDDSLKFVVTEQQASALDGNMVIIELTGTTGCLGRDTVRLLNNAIVNWSNGILDFSGDPTIVISNATIPENIDFFEWDFGDGTTNSTDVNPTHTYTTNGEYEVSLTVSNECGDETQSTTINITGACSLTIPTIAQDGNRLSADVDGVSYQWIDCDTESMVPGATSQSFSPGVSGNFRVEISDGTCTQTSDCFTFQFDESILSIDKKSILVYPNPVSERLAIDVRQTKIDRIELIDVSGKVIFEALSTESIDMSSFKQGIYFLNLYQDKNKVTKKIIKQ